jgi:microcystin-dependent protein
MSFGGTHVQGETGGSQGVTLGISQIPAHTHTVNCNKMGGTTTSAVGTYPAFDGDYPVYSGSGNAALAPTAVGGAGSDQPHNNMAPYLVMTACICLVGIFPSRN